MCATLCFSTNDVAIKFLSGDYPLHQIVLVRSVFGVLLTLAIFIPLEGGLIRLKTSRLGLHILRGLCVVFANMCFFAALATLKLSDAVAIFFISPLVVTAFSVLFLGEKAGPRRWLGVGVGLLGVLVMVRPGMAAFQFAALLPLAAAVGYASLHTLTRKIGVRESASTMAIYIQFTFIVVSSLIGLGVGDGRFAGSPDPSINFLLRAWVWPNAADFALMAGIGMIGAVGGYLISQAYRSNQASLIAPFEYIAMPAAIFWGVVVFDEWPDAIAWVGITLIIGAGLFVFWRESVANRDIKASLTVPRHR